MAEEKFEVKLPKRRIEELQEAKRTLEDVEREIERAREAGIDVRELEDKLYDTKGRVERLLRVYGGE